jgi:biopolymer transport protein ExbD
MWTNLSRLQRRVRNRRLSNRRPALCSSLNSPAFAHSALGCVVLFLIIAMISDPPHHGMALDRYISHNATPMPAALRDDAMRVMLTRDGSIYLANHRVASEDLPEQIRRRLQSGAQHKVFLVVDQRARYRDLSIVLDELRYARIWDITFLTESALIRTRGMS